MAAEVAKLRSQQCQDFVSGEKVWVDSTYFDDPKSAPENRFSTTCEKVHGVILSVSSESCKVLFDDGTKSYVRKSELHLVGQANIVYGVNPITTDDEEQEDRSEN